MTLRIPIYYHPEMDQLFIITQMYYGNWILYDENDNSDRLIDRPSHYGYELIGEL